MVEHQIVALAVVGSNPIIHPKQEKRCQKRHFFLYSSAFVAVRNR